MATKLDLYSDLTRPEHEAWKQHRNLLGALTPGDAVFRNCIGLAMLIHSQTADSWIDTGDKRTFVHDRNVRWASMTDVPPGYFQTANARHRPVSWATVRPTTTKFGVPVLDRGTEGTDAWDFRALKQARTADLPALDAEGAPQLFRCFNAMNWAMSSVAFNFNRHLEYAVPAFRSAVSALYDLKTAGDVMLCAGGGVYDGAAYPHQWMPKAYLGFKREMRGEVFDRATMRPEERYSYSLCDTFLDAAVDNLAYRPRFSGRVQAVRLNVKYHNIPVTELVLAGDKGEHEVVRFMRGRCRVLRGTGREFEAGEVVAEDRFDCKLPRTWHDMPVKVRMNEKPDCPVGRLLGRDLDPVLRLWFERQAVELTDGFVHYPSAISSVAGLSAAVESALFWEVSDAAEYYRDDCDALVFPPVPCDRWFHLSGWLPGDVKYDLTPAHRSFITFEDLRERLRAGGPKSPQAIKLLEQRLAKNDRERAKKARQLNHGG